MDYDYLTTPITPFPGESICPLPPWRWLEKPCPTPADLLVQLFCFCLLCLAITIIHLVGPVEDEVSRRARRYMKEKFGHLLDDTVQPWKYDATSADSHRVQRSNWAKKYGVENIYDDAEIKKLKRSHLPGDEKEKLKILESSTYTGRPVDKDEKLKILESSTYTGRPGQGGSRTATYSRSRDIDFLGKKSYNRPKFADVSLFEDEDEVKPDQSIHRNAASGNESGLGLASSKPSSKGQQGSEKSNPKFYGQAATLSRLEGQFSADILRRAEMRAKQLRKVEREIQLEEEKEREERKRRGSL